MAKFTTEQQLAVLSDEEINSLEQELIKKSTGGRLLSSAKGFGEGALLGLQGRPISELSAGTSKEGNELETFRQKERIKREIKAEFETDEEPSAKEKIETKLLEAVANQLGIQTDAVDVNEDGEVAVKTDINLPPGTTITVGGVSLPVVSKKTASQEKRDVEKTQLSDELKGLFQSFAKARTEGEEGFGEAFGARGPLGRITGKAAGVKGKIGLSPAIDVFNSKRKAFATVVAKAAGEVRPTDVDIERFVETLMSTERSDEENELIMQDLLRKVESGDRDELRQLWENATGRKISGDQSSTEGVEMIDAQGNKALVDPSTGQVIKEL